MSSRSILSFIIAFIAFTIVSSSIFIVHQKNQAIVLQFGEFKAFHHEPGLKVKVPFIQDILFYEKRIIDYASDPISVTTVDEKRLNVDAYVRYRIVDALAFFRSIKPANENGVRMRLKTIVPSSIRNVLGKVELRMLLSPERATIMKKIQDEIVRLTQALGLEIVDVRIVRTELPTENRSAVFDRMNAILIRYAKENRAKGDEIARGIRANADRERTVLLADAQKKAQSIRGRGDAEAIEITNTAFGVDLDFYGFYRSLETYRQTLQTDTSMMLSSDHPYLQHFSSHNKK